jgi:hypothetical protein
MDQIRDSKNFMNEDQGSEVIDGEHVTQSSADVDDEPSFADEPLEGLTSQVEVRPGDLVEYWPDNGARATAVVLRMPNFEQGQAKSRYVTINGRGSIDYTESKRYLMVVPEFMDREHIESVAQEKGALIPGNTRLHVIAKRAHEFSAKSEQLRSEYAERLANLYQLLPEVVRKQAMPVSCAEAARLVFETEDVTPHQIHAVHASMMRDRTHFLPDTVHTVTVPVFRSRDPAQVQVITTVTKSVRYRSPAYLNFLQRAKDVAAWGRKATSPDGPLKAMQVPPELRWSAQDERYIDFLLQATLERPNSVVEIYTTISATIVKDLSLFPDETATRHVVHKTLKKLGVLAPWDISMNRSPTLALPGYGSSSKADKQQAYMDETFSDEQVSSKSINEFGLRDQLAKQRYDFGDMPVYTIDSESAHELDDGISLGEDGWMHVHIANPAAFIKPNRGIGVIAQHRGATRYLDYTTLPMLPTALTMAHFSLAKRKTGTPTITTSFTLKPSGELDQIRVRPSIIRNVIRTSYKTVDAALGGDLSVYGKPIVLSSNWQEEEAPPAVSHDAAPQDNLTQADIAQLKKMYTFLEPSLQYRISQGAIEFPDKGEYIASLRTQPAVLPGMQPSKIPTFYSGKPGIRYTFAQLDPKHPVAMPKATRIVTEAAILANHATALFCQRNKISVMYRAAEFPMTPEQRKKLLSLRLKNGMLKTFDFLEYQHFFRPTQVSLEPKRMDYVGLPVYMTITSPLRRFADMCGQWALQNFWKASSKHAEKDVNITLDLEAMLPELERTMLAIKRRSALSGQNVIWQLLEQKWEAGELSGPVDAVVFKPPRTVEQQGYSATVPAWGHVRVLVSRKASEPLLVTGDGIKVEIESFDHFDFNINCKRVA